MNKTDNKEKFLFKLGNRIRVLREEKGISQTHLADVLETSQAHLSKIENGIREPGIFTLYKLSKALGISLSFLVDLYGKS